MPADVVPHIKSALLINTTNLRGNREMTKLFNIPVNILSMGFGRDLRAIPRRMEFEGRAIDFIDSGICTTVRRGASICQVLALSDGSQIFHLRNDRRNGIWTLIGIN